MSNLGTCPNCGGTIIESPRAFSCENWTPAKGQCKFGVWKEIAGRPISEEEASIILRGETTPLLDGFVSKKGSTFSTKLKMNFDTSRVEFEFDN